MNKESWKMSDVYLAHANLAALSAEGSERPGSRAYPTPMKETLERGQAGPASFERPYR